MWFRFRSMILLVNHWLRFIGKLKSVMGSLKNCSTYCKRKMPQSKLFDCNGTCTLWPSIVFMTSKVPWFLADHSLCRYCFSVAITAGFFECSSESNIKIAGRLVHWPSLDFSSALSASASGEASSAESSMSKSTLATPGLQRSLSLYFLVSKTHDEMVVFLTLFLLLMIRDPFFSALSKAPPLNILESIKWYFLNLLSTMIPNMLSTMLCHQSNIKEKRPRIIYLRNEYPLIG